MAKKDSYKGIPAAIRADVRKALAARLSIRNEYRREPVPTPQTIYAEMVRADQQREESRKAEMADFAESSRTQRVERAKDDLNDHLRALAILRDTLASMARGEDKEETLEDRAIYAHALLEKTGRVAEQSLCTLGIVPETKGVNEGYFCEKLKR